MFKYHHQFYINICDGNHLIYFYYNEILTDELIEDRLIPIYNFKAN